ncbi:MAG TPA: hypothetical protein VMY39_01590 [Planctomycetota bacterium]|nr:hypothetical protein [Planctomycetota bacterium]
MTLKSQVDEARGFLEEGGAEGAAEEILCTIHSGAKLLARFEGDREESKEDVRT